MMAILKCSRKLTESRTLVRKGLEGNGLQLAEVPVWFSTSSVHVVPLFIGIVGFISVFLNRFSVLENLRAQKCVFFCL